MERIALEAFPLLIPHLVKENPNASNNASRSLNESNSSLSLLSVLKPIVNDQDAITWLNPVCVSFNFKYLVLT